MHSCYFISPMPIQAFYVENGERTRSRSLSPFSSVYCSRPSFRRPGIRRCSVSAKFFLFLPEASEFRVYSAKFNLQHRFSYLCFDTVTARIRRRLAICNPIHVTYTSDAVRVYLAFDRVITNFKTYCLSDRGGFIAYKIYGYRSGNRRK